MLSEGHIVPLYGDRLAPQYTILLMTTLDINCANHPMILSLKHLRNTFSRSRLAAQMYVKIGTQVYSLPFSYHYNPVPGYQPNAVQILWQPATPPRPRATGIHYAAHR